MLEVHPVRAFSDNYIWLLVSPRGEACVVDPGDAAPVVTALESRGLRLAAVLVTHHHPDHVGGVDALLDHCGAVPVYGPRGSPARCITHPLEDGEELHVLGSPARVIAVPGHTLDHIAYFLPEESPPRLFCGDTLFAGGCGRVFEGDPQMMHTSLSRLAVLPGATLAYCAHEYTMSNLRFARVVEPANALLAEREVRDAARRERGEPTVPSTLALELGTNPFLRCTAPGVRGAALARAGRELPVEHEVFAVIRNWKDGFR